MGWTDDINGSSTGGWVDPLPPEEGDGGTWTAPTAAAVNPWDRVEPPTQLKNPWADIKQASGPKKPSSSTKPTVKKPNLSTAEQNTPAIFKTTGTDTGGWNNSPVQSQNGGWSTTPEPSKNGSSNGWGASPDPAAAEIDGKSAWDSIDEGTAKDKSGWDSIDEGTAKAKGGWDSIDEGTAKAGNPWESRSVCNAPAGKMKQKHTSTGVKTDLNPKCPEIAAGPPPECEEVDVPDSAVPHIIGQEHRTIRALKNVPGIMEVTISMVKGIDEDVKKTPLQRVKVAGSSKEAVTRVVTQIRRIVLRSATNSSAPEMSVTCLSQENDNADAVCLKLAAAEELNIYMPKNLKTFVVQHAPQDLIEKKYFIFGARTSSDQLTDNTKIVSRKRRRSYEREGADFLFGSWDANLHSSPLSSYMRKFYEQADASFRVRPPQIKLRIQLGKIFYFGTDFKAPDTWNVSLEEMKRMTTENTLKPSFSCYCPLDIAEKARKFLKASGYERHKVAISQDTICAELVDMDAPDKPSFNIRFLQRDKIAAKINKKSRRHAYVTFANGKGVDFQLRIQSRQREREPDEKTRKQVYEAWSKRTNIEEPLISPTGHRYYPLKVLQKVFEYYRKAETEYVLTRVSAVIDTEGPKEIEDSHNSRWKISLQRCLIPYAEDVDEDVKDTMTWLTSMVTEAKDFLEAISSA